MYNSSQNLSEIVEQIGTGMFSLLKINNFSSLLKKLGFRGYEHLINGLGDKIIQDIECCALQINEDNLWLVSKSDITSSLNDAIKKYLVDKKIYLSTTMDQMRFIGGDHLDQLKCQVLSNLEPNYEMVEPDKVYNLYENIYNKKIFIALQPIVERGGKEYCYECLLRSYDKLFSSTSESVNIAEQAGLINILDEYILGLVVNEIKKDKNLILSINLSYKSINDSSWSQNFIKNIEKHGIANNLIIEITETAVKNNYTGFTKFINDVHKIGVKVSLDDFGTGYTSFVQLRSFNVDFVKIDGLFIRNILYDRGSLLFVKSVINIAQSLGIKVVAECVENKQTAQILEDWGVDYLQGFYFGKPFKA